jgi:uncharacterized membrane protein HdeD (DUF308 family)
VGDRCETLLVLAVLFGIQLIISGIFRLVGAFATDDPTGGTAWTVAMMEMAAAFRLRSAAHTAPSMA